jgi:hypothetical protein
VQFDSVWGTGSPGPVSGLPMLTNGFVAVDGVSCADENNGTHFRLTFGAGTSEAFTVDSGSWDHGPDGSRAIVEAAIEWAEGMTYGPTVRLVYARGPRHRAGSADLTCAGDSERDTAGAGPRAAGRSRARSASR